MSMFKKHIFKRGVHHQENKDTLCQLKFLTFIYCRLMDTDSFYSGTESIRASVCNSIGTPSSIIGTQSFCIGTPSFFLHRNPIILLLLLLHDFLVPLAVEKIKHQMALGESKSNCTQSKEHSRIFQKKLLIQYVLVCSTDLTSVFKYYCMHFCRLL
jgi:hypothetical protein